MLMKLWKYLNILYRENTFSSFYHLHYVRNALFIEVLGVNDGFGRCKDGDLGGKSVFL